MKPGRFAIVVLLAASVWAQEAAPATRSEGSSAKPRPRVGLVLEGGGALGLAHVGVLHWLEENRIPVDVIAGTSMGGLIGGVYATGESPNQIRALIRGIHWNEVLRGVTPYQNLSFRRKEDRREYPNAFEFGLKHGAQFPSGFNSGQQVGLILSRVGLPYSEMRSFDDLPIPFRCVATDLVTQEAYVFDRGSLALALRATMSMPAFFSPVREGDHVLVDGGLLDNLPVDVARKMGADIVIAVHLKTKAVNPQEAMSSVGVLQRSASVTIAINELRSMEKADIVLTADTEDFSATDYPRFAEIEEEGYKAAQEKHALLAGLQVGTNEWQQLQSARAQKRLLVPTPQFVDVSGANDSITRGLKHRLAGLVGEPVDENDVDEQMMNITGLGRFSRAGYAIREKSGQPGLAVDAEEKGYAPPTVHPQLLIDGSDYKNVLFQVGGRITFLDFGGFGSEWRNDFVAGSEYGLNTEYYHPFTAYTHWFTAVYGMADSSPFNVYQRNRVMGEYRNRRMGGGIDLGYVFGRSGELRAGYQAGYQKLSEDIGVPVTPAVHGRFGITSLRYRLERFDDPVIPRSGVRVESTFKFYDANPGTEEVVPTDELRFGLAHRTSERSSLLFFASGGTAFATRDTGFPPFSLGGPLRLGAYGMNELLTNQYFLFQPAFLYRLRELSPLLKQNVYLLSMYEAGKAYGQPAGVPRIQQDGTIGVLFQTVFGPMFFGGSLGDTQHRKFYFKVGKFF
ncbi:MAG: patatin-like phospholipase family protein [Acidobacteriia bacterium]|nr:patatin-like phospholipase family protein [Terriglobia bacterium]